MSKQSTKVKVSMAMIVFALLEIPIVHLIAPMFHPEVAPYVSTGGGSIIGQTNVYLQLLPYVLAYLSAPVIFVWGLVIFRKSKRNIE